MQKINKEKTLARFKYNITKKNVNLNEKKSIKQKTITKIILLKQI